MFQAVIKWPFLSLYELMRILFVLNRYKKPVVIDNEIVIREKLNMTVVVDHNVIDGGPMVWFLNDLT